MKKSFIWFFALLFISLSFVGTASAEPKFRIGVATPTVSQAEDAYRGAENIVKEYGDASKGGMIKQKTK